MELLGQERSLTIPSSVRIQYTNVTDGRTDTGRQQRIRLRNASRGNKKAGCQLNAVDVTVAEKTASNFRGLLFVAPCTTCQAVAPSRWQ